MGEFMFFNENYEHVIKKCDFYMNWNKKMSKT